MIIVKIIKYLSLSHQTFTLISEPTYLHLNSKCQSNIESILKLVQKIICKVTNYMLSNVKCVPYPNLFRGYLCTKCSKLWNRKGGGCLTKLLSRDYFKVIICEVCVIYIFFHRKFRIFYRKGSNVEYLLWLIQRGLKGCVASLGV